MRNAGHKGNKTENEVRCNRCNGLGTVSYNAGRVKCPVCNGTGKVPIK